MMQTKRLCDPWMLMPLNRLSESEENEIILQVSKI